MGRGRNPGWTYVCCALAATALAVTVSAQSTEMVSVSSDGVQGIGSSSLVAMSSDGRYVSFTSDAPSLVPGDSNGAFDQFLRDRQTGQTIRVSVSSQGAEGNLGGAGYSSVSDDGRFVAFTSPSNNLDPEDSDTETDVFVRDLVLGTTTLVSKSSSTFTFQQNGSWAAMSGDGRYVAFQSWHALTPEDQSIGTEGMDVFVHDRIAVTTSLVSVSLSGVSGSGKSEYPTISGDGRYVAFESSAYDLVTTDTNGGRDVFVRDLVTGTTVLASVSSSGLQGSGIGYNAVLSRTGRYIAFNASSPELIAPYSTGLVLRDLVAGTTKSVGLDFAGGGNPAISDDGRYVAFVVGLPGPPQADIYVRDMNGTSFLAIDVAPDGGPPNDNDYSSPLAMSADGRYVAFQHHASNLVVSPADSNQLPDVFVRDTLVPPPPPQPWTDLGSGLDGTTGVPALAGTGSLEAGSLVTLALTAAKPFSLSILVVGVGSLELPFKGGIMVPEPDFLFPLLTDFFGSADFGGLWPGAVPADFMTYFQWWIEDPGGPKGFAASNALVGTTP